MGSQDNQLLAVAESPISTHRAVSRRRAGRRQDRFRGALRVVAVAGLLATSCVAFLVASSWMRSQGAVNVVRAQLEAIRTGKVEQAYAFFSSDYQAGMSLPRYRRWLRRHRPLANAQDLQFWRRSVRGEKAALWGSFQDDLGHSYPVRYHLVRENGSWRIDSFRLSPEVPDSFRAKTRFIHI